MALLQYFNLDLTLIIQSYAGEILELSCCYKGSELPKMPNLKYLEYTGDYLEDIISYKNIVHLDLSIFRGNISFLSELKSLTSLNLNRFKGGISVLSQLKSLNLYNFNGDISPLTGLKSLTSLDLYNFSGDVSSLTGLKSLVLGSKDGDISSLTKLKSLRSLTLVDFGRGDISVLTKSLTSLNLGSFN